jgi:hypothetical protein
MYKLQVPAEAGTHMLRKDAIHKVIFVHDEITCFPIRHFDVVKLNEINATFFVCQLFWTSLG